MDYKILKWKCDECPKEIVSLYQGQLDHLILQHKLTHKKKVEKL